MIFDWMLSIWIKFHNRNLNLLLLISRICNFCFRQFMILSILLFDYFIHPRDVYLVLDFINIYQFNFLFHLRYSLVCLRLLLLQMLIIQTQVFYFFCFLMLILILLLMDLISCKFIRNFLFSKILHRVYNKKSTFLSQKSIYFQDFLHFIKFSIILNLL